MRALSALCASAQGGFYRCACCEPPSGVYNNSVSRVSVRRLVLTCTGTIRVLSASRATAGVSVSGDCGMCGGATSCGRCNNTGTGLSWSGGR